MLNDCNETAVNENAIHSMSDNEKEISSQPDIRSSHSSDTDTESLEGELKTPVFDSETSDFDFLSEESDDDCNDQLNIKQELAAWAVLFLIKNDALSALLCILKRYGLSVPKDARTLLKTPRHVEVLTKANGSYIYFGIQQAIMRQLAKI